MKDTCYYPNCNESVTNDPKFCVGHTRRKNTMAAPKKAAPKKKAKRAPAVDWEAKIKAIKKAKEYPVEIELSSPGVAQVQRVRLHEADYFKGLVATTKGPVITIRRGRRAR